MTAPAASPNAHFLAGDLPSARVLPPRSFAGTALSIVVHAVGLSLLLYAATHAPEVAKILTDLTPNRSLIYVAQKGPSSGSGKSHGDSERPRPAEIVRASRANPLTPITNPVDVPTPDISVSAQTPQASQTIPGTLTQLDVPGTGVPGTGPGNGVSGGRGPGEGPGDSLNRGSGNGPYQVGNGVSSPFLIHEVRPNYTSDAMRAKLTGKVELEAIVRPDGTVDPTSIQITRSLDSTFGLDQQAIAAVKLWRFRPGTLKGQPVAVIVNIELTFMLR